MDRGAFRDNDMMPTPGKLPGQVKRDKRPASSEQNTLMLIIQNVSRYSLIQSQRTGPLFTHVQLIRLALPYEVIFKVRPIQAMKVYHKTYTLDEFEKALSTLRIQKHSITMGLNSILATLTVKFRQYHPTDNPQRLDS